MPDISIRLFTQQPVGIPRRPTVGHSVDNTLGDVNAGDDSRGHQSPQESFGSLNIPSPAPERPNKRRRIAHPEDEPFEFNAVASDGNNTSPPNSYGSPIRDGGFEGITTTNSNDEGFGDDGPRNEYDVRTTANIANSFPVSKIINRMMNVNQILEVLKTALNLLRRVWMIQMKRLAKTKPHWQRSLRRKLSLPSPLNVTLIYQYPGLA